MSSYTVSMGTNQGYQPVPAANPPPPQYSAAPPPTMGTYQPVSTNSTNVAVINTAPPAQTLVFTPGPPNYMVLNIIALLFCCFFFGLIGVIYSMKVDSEWSAGNHAGAHEASRMARNWGYASIFTGVGIIAVSVVAFIILMVVTFSVSASE